MGFGLLSSCKSNDDTELELEFESTAIILGFDIALCPCCGGWIINIDEQESDNRFSELPQDSNIDLENAIFPISVKLNWSESDAFCGIGIVIESIELIE
ncbi:hypothetical protein A9Q86_03750 [Flavobacteriales bacterium 33_180_T64]|nr:hypothetical protein A9Q86_03750 [Flavobacteriales bacterium 33_180_T64]